MATVELKGSGRGCDGNLSIQPEQRKPSNKRAKKSKRRRLPRDASIAIIGSGMGGLSTAIALKKAGFTNITVYERDNNFSERKDGYGLTLSYNPKGPLAKLGLLEKVARVDCPSRSHYVFKPDGSILGYYGNAFHNIGSTESRRGLGQRGNLRVPRQVLRRIMLNELLAQSSSSESADGSGSAADEGKVRIKWGKRLVSFKDRVAQTDGNTFSCDEKGTGAVSLKFEDGTAEEADLLVGSDGIRSTVTRTLLANRKEGGMHTEDGLSYLGIMIILGITDNFAHPLLDERGFYTLDGTHRLFTMPYCGSKLDDILCSNDKNTVEPRRRYMWQFSWYEPDFNKARELSRAGSKALQKEVERRCQGWHEPVLDMVQATSLKNIWGTGLQDRNPQQVMSLIPGFRSGGQSRVVVLGDAFHAMSCFKGQGANQALADGPLLTSWLEKSSIDSAIRGFMREMAARTGEKVKASRDAATFLHSPRVLEKSEDFAGVRKEMVPDFLNFLEKERIGASLGGKLDSFICELIAKTNRKYVPAAEVEEDKANSKDMLLEADALAYATSGDTAGLRRLPPGIIHCAVDLERRTCLHLAALGGHYFTCRFLLTESFVPCDILDSAGNTPLHSACLGRDLRTMKLLSAISRESKACWNNNAEGLNPSSFMKMEMKDMKSRDTNPRG